MNISEIGEFGLIDQLTKDIKLQNTETLCGVGDDCAILRGDDETDILVTTDLLMEGIHFDLTYIPMKHLGYKSAIVNLSDIYAMGGTPKQITVSLAISKRFQVEDMEDFYEGLRIACKEHQVDIVGGDTTSSMTGLAISITAIGTVEHGKAIRRNGAKATDIVCVSGDLGAAYMGFQLLEREKQVYYKQIEEIQKKLAATTDEAAKKQLQQQMSEVSQPDFAGKEYLIERQMRPSARRDIIEQLRSQGIQPTAMIDISDGLSSEILHICKQSGVGCRIYEERIPIDYQTAVMSEEMNMNLTTAALNGGEDYELLFTVPVADHEKIEAMEGVKEIGYITQSNLGSVLITRDGNEFPLKAQGWTHLNS